MYKYKIDIISALAEKGVTYYSCRKNGLFSQGTLRKLRNGENVTLATLDRVCNILGCQLSDIIEIIPDSDISD